MTTATFQVRVQKRRRVVEERVLPSGGTTQTVRWEDDGVEVRDVRVEVDMEALAQTLGPRAIRSKGGKAIEASGNVVVRVVR